MSADPSSNQNAALMELSPQRADVERAVGAILGAVARHGYPEASKFAVRLAVEEALSNAFHHGHRELASTPVRLEYRIDAQRVVITVEDQGPGFDPGTVPDPTLDENLERPSGRGLMLIRAFMTRVTFNARGNLITMEYERPEGPCGA